MATNIALISCDTYPGNIQVKDVFGVAEKTNVTAIVFYTQASGWCDLQDYKESEGSYPWIYSTKDQTEASQLLQAAFSPDADRDGEVYATIGPLMRSTNGTSAAAGSGDAGDKSGASNGDHHKGPDMNPLGPSPSTAVAMIILYSITGIITALFLVIIITGALRAHRHPERYGPRTVAGRPRQSRARGLGRAILETLPIVKFGEQQEPKPDDVELAENRTSPEQTTERNATATEQRQENPAQDQSNERPSQPRQSVEGGIAAAVNGNQSNSEAVKPDNLGCSICTEDFEAGQDQRVLPCDHRFHPDCIDPWLLNVSGTCPLCRIDLNPQASEIAETGELDENGNLVVREGETSAEASPPLAEGATAGERQRMSIRRSIVIGLMGVARPDRMTREERVLWLRQLRGQQLARERREEQAAVDETPEEERSRRARFRRIFGIRTRQTGQTEEQTPPENPENGESQPEGRS